MKVIVIALFCIAAFAQSSSSKEGKEGRLFKNGLEEQNRKIQENFTTCIEAEGADRKVCLETALDKLDSGVQEKNKNLIEFTKNEVTKCKENGEDNKAIAECIRKAVKENKTLGQEEKDFFELAEFALEQQQKQKEMMEKFENDYNCDEKTGECKLTEEAFSTYVKEIKEDVCKGEGACPAFSKMYKVNSENKTIEPTDSYKAEQFLKYTEAHKANEQAAYKGEEDFEDYYKANFIVDPVNKVIKLTEKRQDEIEAEFTKAMEELTGAKGGIDIDNISRATLYEMIHGDNSENEKPMDIGFQQPIKLSDD